MRFILAFLIVSTLKPINNSIVILKIENQGGLVNNAYISHMNDNYSWSSTEMNNDEEINLSEWFQAIGFFSESFCPIIINENELETLKSQDVCSGNGWRKSNDTLTIVLEPLKTIEVDIVILIDENAVPLSQDDVRVNKAINQIDKANEQLSRFKFGIELCFNLKAEIMIEDSEQAEISKWTYEDNVENLKEVKQYMNQQNIFRSHYDSSIRLYYIYPSSGQIGKKADPETNEIVIGNTSDPYTFFHEFLHLCDNCTISSSMPHELAPTNIMNTNITYMRCDVLIKQRMSYYRKYLEIQAGVDMTPISSHMVCDPMKSTFPSAIPLSQDFFAIFDYVSNHENNIENEKGISDFQVKDVPFSSAGRLINYVEVIITRSDSTFPDYEIKDAELIELYMEERKNFYKKGSKIYIKKHLESFPNSMNPYITELIEYSSTL